MAKLFTHSYLWLACLIANCLLFSHCTLGDILAHSGALTMSQTSYQGSVLPVPGVVDGHLQARMPSSLLPLIESTRNQYGSDLPAIDLDDGDDRVGALLKTMSIGSGSANSLTLHSGKKDKASSETLAAKLRAWRAFVVSLSDYLIFGSSLPAGGGVAPEVYQASDRTVPFPVLWQLFALRVEAHEKESKQGDAKERYYPVTPEADRKETQSEPMDADKQLEVFEPQTFTRRAAMTRNKAAGGGGGGHRAGRSRHHEVFPSAKGKGPLQSADDTRLNNIERELYRAIPSLARAQELRQQLPSHVNEGHKVLREQLYATLTALISFGEQGEFPNPEQLVHYTGYLERLGRIDEALDMLTSRLPHWKYYEREGKLKEATLITAVRVYSSLVEKKYSKGRFESDVKFLKLWRNNPDRLENLTLLREYFSGHYPTLDIDLYLMSLVLRIKKQTKDWDISLSPQGVIILELNANWLGVENLSIKQRMHYLVGREEEVFQLSTDQFLEYVNGRVDSLKAGTSIDELRTVRRFLNMAYDIGQREPHKRKFVWTLEYRFYDSQQGVDAAKRMQAKLDAIKSSIGKQYYETALTSMRQLISDDIRVLLPVELSRKLSFCHLKCTAALFDKTGDKKYYSLALTLLPQGRVADEAMLMMANVHEHLHNTQQAIDSAYAAMQHIAAPQNWDIERFKAALAIMASNVLAFDTSAGLCIWALMFGSRRFPGDLNECAICGENTYFRQAFSLVQSRPEWNRDTGFPMSQKSQIGYILSLQKRLEAYGLYDQAITLGLYILNDLAVMFRGNVGYFIKASGQDYLDDLKRQLLWMNYAVGTYRIEPSLEQEWLQQPVKFQAFKEAVTNLTNTNVPDYHSLHAVMIKYTKLLYLIRKMQKNELFEDDDEDDDSYYRASATTPIVTLFSELWTVLSEKAKDTGDDGKIASNLYWHLNELLNQFGVSLLGIEMSDLSPSFFTLSLEHEPSLKHSDYPTPPGSPLPLLEIIKRAITGADTQ
ncbi:MAG: hypothetical protein ACR2PT_10490 [Endozoicomonas sp.]